MRGRLPRYPTAILAALCFLLALAACGAAATSQPVAPPIEPSLAAPTVAPTLVAAATVAPPTAAPPTAVPPAVTPAAPPTPTGTSTATATARPPTATIGPPTPTVTRPAPTATAATAPTRPPVATATATRPPAAPSPTATRPAPNAAPTTAPVGKARTIDRGPATRRVIALTFDAGADRGYAERILNTLRDTNVTATFGMTGLWAEKNPDLVRRMVAEGHLLMNHTYGHASFTGRSTGKSPLTAEERRREIERTEFVIRGLVGAELKPYFRPPYGDYDEATLTQLWALGYGYNVMWTVDSLGWNGYSVERIIARCVGGAAPGAILLFHVGADSQDAAALPELIRQLRAAGYGFVTIEELVR